MPISDDEWEQEELEGSGLTIPDRDLKKDLVTSFLAENADKAYTRKEILVGVKFGNSTTRKQSNNRFIDAREGFLDTAGSIAASGLLIRNLSDVLEELVEEGLVKRKVIFHEGDEKVFYRICSETYEES